MQQLHFYKFDGAGNDFVLVDARERDPHLSVMDIAQICHRRFGVGADGLMTLHRGPEGYDFEMKYYNSDGRPAEMCGNGARCISVFAYLLGVGDDAKHLRFMATDGPHEVDIESWDSDTRKGVVRLGMRAVADDEVSQVLDGTLLNTGVPHFVLKVNDLERYDVVGEGRRLRHHPAMGAAGANVNFVELDKSGVLHVRTYERGVEDETLACGTGVTACAIAMGVHKLKALGGDFCVNYSHADGRYGQVQLVGPVSLNFEGDLMF